MCGNLLPDEYQDMIRKARTARCINTESQQKHYAIGSLAKKFPLFQNYTEKNQVELAMKKTLSKVQLQ